MLLLAITHVPVSLQPLQSHLNHLVPPQQLLQLLHFNQLVRPSPSIPVPSLNQRMLKFALMVHSQVAPAPFRARVVELEEKCVGALMGAVHLQVLLPRQPLHHHLQLQPEDAQYVPPRALRVVTLALSLESRQAVDALNRKGRTYRECVVTALDCCYGYSHGKRRVPRSLP